MKHSNIYTAFLGFICFIRRMRNMFSLLPTIHITYLQVLQTFATIIYNISSHEGKLNKREATYQMKVLELRS